MRKVTAGLFHSLDGAVEAPDQWQFDSFDDELGAMLGKTIAATDTVILGRVGYEEWAGFWPNAEFDDDFKTYINTVPKHVASRTLKGNGNFPYVAERRGVIFIERSLKQGLQFARHKNNTEGLRAQVRRTITAFLLAQMNNGAFRSKTPSTAFFVDVSEQLNTPTVIFAGKLIARVGLATNKPAEFIILRISQDTRALEAELAAAEG